MKEKKEKKISLGEVYPNEHFVDDIFDLRDRDWPDSREEDFVNEEVKKKRQDTRLKVEKTARTKDRGDFL